MIRLIAIQIFISFWAFNVYAQDRLLSQKIDMNRSIEVPVNLPSNNRLVLAFEIQSQFATHYTYDHYIGDVKILFSGIKLHVYKDSSFLCQNFLTLDSTFSTRNFSKEAILVNGRLMEVKNKELLHHGNPVTGYFNETNSMVFYQDKIKYAQKDTNIFVKVFLVNPINSANVIYGGNYSDNNDLSNSSLDNELFWKKVRATFDSDTFFLLSEFLYFDDLSVPKDTSFYSFKDSLYFSREDDAFEYLNTYYHINSVGQYVNDLGYDILTDTLIVDVHAFGGQDNSGYTPSNHSLQFGDGGIDDAEDGEVVVHEFVHSLSEIASPNNTIGRQREAMEEGSCDYFSKAYSRTFNDNTPNKIFSWDGNQTWNGIPINTNRKYPDDLVDTKDGDRDMWSSALMCIHDKIGRLACDSLVLEHFFYQAPNTTMPYMAQKIVAIDSSNFDARYRSSIIDCFVNAGFINELQDTPQSYSLKVINQLGFSLGETPLSIDLPSSASYEIYTILGQKITDKRFGNVQLFPNQYTPGYYIIMIAIDNTIIPIKFIR